MGIECTDRESFHKGKKEMYDILYMNTVDAQRHVKSMSYKDN